MKVAIFGANGQTGRLATALALEHGHHVAAVTRRPAEFPLTGGSLEVIEADARDPAAVSDIVSGVDAVLSTLGVTFTREPVDTYSAGTANIVAGCARRETVGWWWSVRPPPTPPRAVTAH